VRVLIDTSYVARGRSGTGVYVDRLVDALRRRGEVDVVEARQRRRLSPGLAGRRRNPLRSAANALLDLVWLHASLPRAARAAGAQVVHHPLPAHTRRLRTAQVVTVHDVAFERLPAAYDRAWLAFARRSYRHAVRRADAVVCVSEATAAEVVALLGAPPGGLTVAPHGPGQDLPAVERRADPRHFLYVGDDEPRKGLPGLLEAYAAYHSRSERPLELVLAGAAARRAGPPGTRGEREVPPARLAELHAGAAALVHPSLHEGFGLTLLEAMALGTPVVALHTRGVAETCGEAALLVDAAGLSAALERVAANSELRARLSTAGRERAAGFSWKECARLHERAYTLALERARDRK
jgi:glycosyltransferase involved in cell wall biosynthesis